MRNWTIAVSMVVGVLAASPCSAATTVGIVTGAGENGNTHVKRFPAFGPEDQSYLAFPGFSGEVRTAAGDVNGDGLADTIVGAGPGAPGGHIRVFDHGGTLLSSFFAFDGGFTGGTYVAAGKPFGGTLSNLVVGAGAGAPGGHVKVFTTTGTPLGSFFAFPGFAGGVRVAAGDVTGDGLDNIIVGAGPGAPGGHIKVFNGTGGEIMSFFSFDSAFTGGVFVAAGDVNGDHIRDIIVGADAGPSGGHVKVFDGTNGNLLRSFFAFPGFDGGVRVAAADLNGDGFDDIIVGAGVGAPGGHVKVFSGATTSELASFFSYASAFTGGVYVAGFVPEPGTLLILGTGGLVLLRRSRAFKP